MSWKNIKMKSQKKTFFWIASMASGKILFRNKNKKCKTL